VRANIRILCISEPEGGKPEMTISRDNSLSHDTFSLRICLHPRGISPAGAAGHQFALHYLSWLFSSQHDKDKYTERIKKRRETERKMYDICSRMHCP
jgi:hypothetical protein